MLDPAGWDGMAVGVVGWVGLVWLSVRVGRRSQVGLVVGAAAVVVMALFSFLWVPLHGASGWLVPGDSWFGVYSAGLVAHGQVDQLYAGGKALESFPGWEYLLSPAVGFLAVVGLHLPLHVFSEDHPVMWPALAPLFWLSVVFVMVAVDGLVEKLEMAVSARVGVCLAAAALSFQAVALWGHPEDLIALSLVLFAMVESDRARVSWWLLGCAVLVQPLALLAVPVVAWGEVWRGWRDLVDSAWRIALPSVVLVVPALLLAGATGVSRWVGQGNFTAIDHVTPWARFAPSMGHQLVAEGPGRSAALAVAVVVGLAVRLSYQSTRPKLELMLWAVGVCFAVRCAVEAVMDPFYVVPALVCLTVAGLLRWRRADINVAVIVVAAGSCTVAAFVVGPAWSYYIGYMVPLVVLVLYSVPLPASRVVVPALTESEAGGRPAGPACGDGTAGGRVTLDGYNEPVDDIERSFVGWSSEPWDPPVASEGAGRGPALAEPEAEPPAAVPGSRRYVHPAYGSGVDWCQKPPLPPQSDCAGDRKRGLS